MKIFFPIIFFFVISFNAEYSYAQYLDSTFKFPLVISTFYTIDSPDDEKISKYSLFLTFVKSLDSVFNFDQKIIQSGSTIRVALYDSVVVYNDLRVDTIKNERVFGALSWGGKDEYSVGNVMESAQSIDSYCNIIEPKINYILKKYKINIECDYFLANFLVSLDCPTCWIFNYNDMTRNGDENYSSDFKFSKNKGVQSVVYQDITISDSVKIKAGATIVKVENIPTQLLPYGLLLKLMVSRKDTTTKFVIEQNNRLIECVYAFQKDTIKDFEYKVINDSVGYLKLNAFGASGVTASIRQMLVSDSLKIKKLVIDLRKCSGGLLIEAVRFCDLFFGENVLIGEFSAPQSSFYQSLSKHTTHPDNVLANSKIYVLSDSTTTSGAEIIVGVLKTYKRAVVIGQGTAGDGKIKQTRRLFGVNNYYISMYFADYTIAKKYRLGIDSVPPDEYFIPKTNSDELLDFVMKNSL